ncbi:MAG: disulfide bond formation protein B [Pseudomonadota bacterium]
MDLVWSLGRRWQSWAALVLLCVALEAGALYYQEALYYFPCELCIYTRVWIAAIGLLGIAGWLVRAVPWAVRAVLIGELALVIGLAGVVWKLLAIDYGFAGDGACNLYAQFPAWAPLDQWLPRLFEVQATCGETPQVLFGVSMADGLAVITVALGAVFVLALVGSLVRGGE